MYSIRNASSKTERKNNKKRNILSTENFKDLIAFIRFYFGFEDAETHIVHQNIGVVSIFSRKYWKA